MIPPVILVDVFAPTLQIFGHIMIAMVVLSVHTRVAEEHKIDDKVIKTMRREQVYVMIGIVLIIVGYSIQMLLG